MLFFHFNTKKIFTLLCAGAFLLPSCRTTAFNAAITGDANKMQQLANEGANLHEKNAMAVPKNPLYQLLVRFPLGLTAMAWDIGTLGNFFTGFSFAERILLKKPGDTDDTPINAASLRGYADVVSILLKAGERPDAYTVHKAAREDYAAVINEYLNYNVIGANWKYDGWPLLMWSARDEAPNVTRLLVSRGAYVNYTDNEGRSPLYLAAWNSNVEDARALIAGGASIHTVLTLADNNADADKSLEIVNTLKQAGAPATAFASHYLFGRSYSTLAIAITRAGAAAVQAPPPPAPTPPPAASKPKHTYDSKITKANKKKKAPAPRPAAKPQAAPAPAPKPAAAPAPKVYSRSSILKDFN